MHTPYVAATSFFAGEVEIFDFVTECVKRCIAAMILREILIYLIEYCNG